MKTMHILALCAILPVTAFAKMGGIMSNVVPSDSATGGKSDGRFYHLQYPSLGNRTHFGVDIWDYRGSPIFPAACGEVLQDKSNNTFGNVVHLRHSGFGKGDRDLYTLYLHLDTIADHVVQGAIVCSDRPIGTMGSTGVSANNIVHLHFEMRYFSKLYHPKSLCNGKPNIYACGDVRSQQWAQDD